MADSELTVRYTREKEPEGTRYILRMESIESVEIDKEVFIYQVDLKGNMEFYDIATPDQLVSIPIDTPVPGSTFYRKKTAEIYYDSVREMLSSEEEIKEDIDSLVKEWNTLKGDIFKTYDVTYSGAEE